MARFVNAPFLRAGPLLLERIAPTPGEAPPDAASDAASRARDPEAGGRAEPPDREPSRRRPRPAARRTRVRKGRRA